MKKIQIEDLYKFKALSSTVLSPNGQNLLYVQTDLNEDSNEYDSRLFCLNVETNETYPLTSKGKESSGFWINDDEVAYRVGGKDGKTTYLKISISGGESEEFMSIDAPVGQIKKLSDELYVITKKLSETEENAENRAKEGVDYVVFDELPFWSNGQGVVNKKRNMVCLYNAKTSEITEISPKDMNVHGFTLNDDNSKLLYWGTEFKDVKPRHTEIFEYHVHSGYTELVLETGKLAVSFVRFIGEKLFIEGSDKTLHSSQGPKLYTIRDGKLTEIADLDGSMHGSSGSDIAYGGGSSLEVVGDDIYCLYTSWGNSFLSKVNFNGKLTHVNETVGSINCFDISEGFVYCVAMREYELQELYKIDLKTGKETKLTSVNQAFLDTYHIEKPEYFRYHTKSGVELEGWVIKPCDFEKGKKYPGVLAVHGGPKVVYGTNFNHEMQCMSSKGMFVFYTNPRGSDGRGEEFADLAGKLGEIDFDDLMDFTDEVVRRYDELDADRLGISGGSYGGFICNWAIGNTDRFKAATSQRSISNYISKCLTTDIGYYHNLSQTGADPWTNFEKMWYHSPLKYVKNAKTPTLFIQSDEDYRCWMSEPLQMFSALCSQDVPSKIALFHGENHELSRSGKIKNRLNRLHEICSWLEKYL